MSEVIRDTFIALHSSDILRKLEAEVSILLSCFFFSMFPTISRIVPGALRQPLCTAVGDPEGIDPQDAFGRGL